MNLENHAPFGLTWGATIEEVQQLGVQVVNERHIRGFALYQCVNLPKNVSIAQHYMLYFGVTDGLQKIEMFSEMISNDPSGTEGKSKYETLKQMLVNRYGDPSQALEAVFVNRDGEANEFYECLSDPKCGMWAAIFPTERLGFTSFVRLHGIDHGEGQIVLTYEGAKWPDLIGSYESSNKIMDEDAI